MKGPLQDKDALPSVYLRKLFYFVVIYITKAFFYRCSLIVQPCSTCYCRQQVLISIASLGSGHVELQLAFTSKTVTRVFDLHPHPTNGCA